LYPLGSAALESEVKSGSFIEFRLGPHPAAVAINDALRNCQTNTISLELVAAVETLKDAKELVGILHVEAGAVVLDEIYRYELASSATHFD